MKKYIFLLFSILICIVIIACGKSPSRPSESELLIDLSSYPLNYVFDVEDLSIIRSQKNDAAMTYLADVEFTGSNRFADYFGTAQMIYNLYDQGWMLDTVNDVSISYVVREFQTEEEALSTIENSGIIPYYSPELKEEMFKKAGVVEGFSFDTDSASGIEYFTTYYVSTNHVAFVDVRSITIPILFDGDYWYCSEAYTDDLVYRDFSNYIGSYEELNRDEEVLYLDSIDENALTYTYASAAFPHTAVFECCYTSDSLFWGNHDVYVYSTDDGHTMEIGVEPDQEAYFINLYLDDHWLVKDKSAENDGVYDSSYPSSISQDEQAAENPIPIEGNYVIDLAGLLSRSEIQSLSDLARELSQQNECGVYIGILDDMQDYGYATISRCAEAFFADYNLGVGTEHDGILLLLSMEDRDYDLDAHGSYAQEVFADFSVLEDSFLPYLSNNQWFDGFSAYLTSCQELLGASTRPGTGVS